MQHVLLLTKNVLAEERLIKKLHHLNYEVLCSSDWIEHLAQGKSPLRLNYFQAVILSDTLSDSDLVRFLPNLSSPSLAIIRVSTPEYTEDRDKLSEWVHEWIAKEDSLEQIREALYRTVKETKPQPLNVTFSADFSKIGNNDSSESNLVSGLRIKLSKKEKKVLDHLVAAGAKEVILDRKELCEYIWGIDSDSNMSQLSCLINKIKKKFERAGVPGETITTLWGRGYKLNDEFYRQLLQNASEVKNLVYQMD
ncbi:response regulator transcription factor [Enterococcus sp. 669A]|uniref:Response regulator transcription factor n=1 Tax=Candidatus Enterococcus moelleringii TaxID=2815325 RepID=A0ABS3LH66_9ENTE|nr:winged helix-turn-helix domain-containing protein [Enterococcus sp. 669A]MBO1308056.1 response regulator transcription factor [Enterococcus sp. 669A]